MKVAEEEQGNRQSLAGEVNEMSWLSTSHKPVLLIETSRQAPKLPIIQPTT
jgi:hypothetical protein